MPSVLNVDTLTDAAGTGPVTLTKQSAAKCLFSFNGADSTPAYKKSLNASSLTDNGTGDYTVVFTNSMADKNYTFAGSQTWSSASTGLFSFMIKDDANWDGSNKSTAQVRLESSFISTSSNKTNFDYLHQNGTVHGDLA